jgi:hypothetical protein
MRSRNTQNVVPLGTAASTSKPTDFLNSIRGSRASSRARSLNPFHFTGSQAGRPSLGVVELLQLSGEGFPVDDLLDVVQPVLSPAFIGSDDAGFCERAWVIGPAMRYLLSGIERMLPQPDLFSNPSKAHVRKRHPEKVIRGHPVHSTVAEAAMPATSENSVNSQVTRYLGILHTAGSQSPAENPTCLGMAGTSLTSSRIETRLALRRCIDHHREPRPASGTPPRS